MPSVVPSYRPRVTSRAVRAIDFLCRLAGITEYSALAEYAPITHIRRIKDRAGDVYVWMLRPGVNPLEYTDMMGKMLTDTGADLRALHLFVQDVDDIKRLDAGRVKALLEHFYSDHAQDGGRKP